MTSILRRISATNCHRVCNHHLHRCRHYATEAQLGSKPSSFGQPIYQSHPHLVKPDALTPGIPVTDYERRRKALMDSLPENSVVVSVAAPIKYMSGGIFYKYRQASDFWYLTGFEEPDSAVILEKTSSSKGYRMTLFSTGRDSAKEKWEGSKTPHQSIPSIFRVDEARSIEDFPSHLKSITQLYSQIYVDTPRSSSYRRGGYVRSSAKTLLGYMTSTTSLSPKTEYESIVEGLRGSKRRNLGTEVAKLRAVKSDAEQKVMRSAADISGRAFAKTMRYSSPGCSEAHLAAHFEYLCLLSGAQRLAYVPVVASGPNALIIHYTANNHNIKEDELVLMDAGCEYNGYASDITRTFPSSGRFTPAQADLYAAVLSAQKAVISLCSEASSVSLYDLHRQSVSLLRQELAQIGIKVSREDLERTLYCHHVGHPVGIDLHETGGDRDKSLKAGMVITIEPGIYVPPSPLFPKAFHNMGIRIEDEVLIGEDYPTILSVNAPKEIADVEGACQGLLGLESY